MREEREEGEVARKEKFGMEENRPLSGLGQMSCCSENPFCCVPALSSCQNQNSLKEGNDSILNSLLSCTLDLLNSLLV